MTDHDPIGSDPDIDAAEMALGLRAGRPGERDSASVEAWQARLMPLIAGVAEVTPSPHVWTSIAARLERMEAPRGEARRRSLWDSLALWRFLAAGGVAVAAASLVALFAPVDIMHRRDAQPLVAVLGPGNVSALFTAVYDPAGGAVTLAPIAGAVQDARVPELWYVPAGGAPQSLGVFDPTKQVRIALPERVSARFGPADALAISLEPAGGSPTGSPTGPIIAQGSIRRL